MPTESDATLVRKVRTFADDVRRAQGDAPEESPVTPPPAPSPHTAPPAPIEEEAEAAALPTPPQAPAEQAPQPDASVVPPAGEELFDIRKEASGTKDPTVVRETRRKSWSLTRALGEMFGEWFGDRQREATRALNSMRQAPQPAPESAEQASTSDTDSVTVSESAESNTPTTSPSSATDSVAAPATTETPEEMPTPGMRTFSHDVESARSAPPPPPSAKPTAEAPVNLPVASPTHVGTPDAPAPTRAPEPAAQQTDAPEREAALERMLAARIRTAADIAPTPSAPERSPAAAQPQHDARTVPAEPPLPVQTETPPAAVSPSAAAAATAVAEATRQRRAARVPTPELSPRPFVIAGILMFLIIAVGGPTLFWFANRSPEVAGTVARIPTFIAIDDQVPVPFSEERGEFLTRLTTAAAGSAGVTQLYPTRSMGTDAAAVATSEFMRILDPRAPGSLIRSFAEEMMLGAVATEPFLILKTTQYPATLAGMLDWEPNMSADLAPLFGEPVRRSLDTAARTSDGTRTAAFTDATVAGTDTRILVDATGAERILYAFFDEQTLVIAASRTGLRELLDRLR